MSKSDTGGALTGISQSLKTFSGWKYDLIDAIAADPAVGSVNVHIAVVVIQRIDQRNRKAAVTDEYIVSKVHKNRAACTKFRKRMVELGWLKCAIGRSGRATVYIFSEERLRQQQNIALDQRILDREREDDSVEDTTHHSKLRSAEKIKRYDSVQKHQRKEPQRTQNIANSAKDSKHLHLKTPRLGLPLESKEFTRVREACGGSNDTGWTEQDWRARYNEIAAFLEHEQDLPCAEAEAFAQRQVAEEREAAKSEAILYST